MANNPQPSPVGGPLELDTNTMGVTPTQLRYLVMVSDSPSWTQAAARLGVSGAALSQGLSELQRRLGVDLFEPDGRHRKLTDTGHQVTTHARRILAEYGDLGRYVERIRLGTGGRVAIGMIDTAAVHHFGDTLLGLRRRAPDVAFTLTVRPSSQLLALLDAGELDVIVGVDLPPRDRYKTTHLLHEPLFVYAPPETARNMAATKWGPWVTFPSASRTRRRIARHLGSIGASFEVVAESSQPSVLRGMVNLGLGWTVLCQLDGEAAPKPLRRHHRQPLTSRSLDLSYRSDRTLDPAVANVIEALTRHAATERRHHETATGERVSIGP